MSDHQDPAISAELRAWLFSTIAESIPKALAAFHEQASTEAHPPAHQPNDSEDSHLSDQEGAPHKQPWRRDSVTVGRGKAPAIFLKQSLPHTMQDSIDPLEGSTSRLVGHMMNDYDANYSDEDPPVNVPQDSSTSEFIKETFITQVMLRVSPYLKCILRTSSWMLQASHFFDRRVICHPQSAKWAPPDNVASFL
ncbi:Hypothetical predicted protein [Pelobates cultripes]|uniref:Uncharacterized protein n=1 Tax=Pelobates cultripes TaxID=61616 RepID=A0AAD1W4A0_PELCU|nr:Hypothetical predicted protein [Pelobates cultripes]